MDRDFKTPVNRDALLEALAGELTLQVKSFEILSKSLRPWPEKYHGVTDVETLNCGPQKLRRSAMFIARKSPNQGKAP